MALKNLQDRSLAALGIKPSVRGDVRLIAGAALLMVAVTVLALPWADVQLPIQPAVVPLQAGAIIVANGVTALLLFNQFRVSGARSLLLLAGLFEFGALLALAQFATFPGIFSTFDSMSEVSRWLWVLWHAAFPLAVLWQLAIAGRLPPVVPHRRRRAIGATATCLPVVVLLVAAVLIAVHDWLPVFFMHGARGPNYSSWYLALNGVQFAVAVVAAVLLLTAKSGDAGLMRWLSLVLLAVALEVFCMSMSHSRYSLYWFLGRFQSFIAAIIVPGVLLSRLTRLYAHIADTAVTLSASNAALERGVADRTAELTKALGDRSMLLREVYHRVKNNLQLVDSLLGLQAARLSDHDAKDALADLRSRIYALGLVHQQLMASDNLATFEIEPFLRELSETVTQSSSAPQSSVQLTVDADQLQVNLDFAIPLGLLVTELLSNALKRAFPAGGGHVEVEFRCDDKRRGMLRIADDGLTPGAADPKPPGRRSMGTKIIRALVAQLDGELHITYGHGTGIEVRMPLPEPA